MKESIGKRIQRFRREKGLTQEQAAAALGVTAAAVSKWETDAACPDVALLAPLARLLGVTVDGLLDFRPALAPEEIPALLSESRRLFEKKRAGDAREAVLALLREYPGDLGLSFQGANLLIAYLSAVSDEEEVRLQAGQAARMLEACQESEQPEMRDAARYVLANLYNMLEEPDKALKALEDLHRPEINTRLLRAGIFLEKGDVAAAEREQQLGLYTAGRDACLHLMGLASAASRQEEPQRALELLDRALAVDQLLEMEGVGGMEGSLRLLKAGRLCAMGRLEEAREEVEGYVDASLRLVQTARSGRKQGGGLYSRTEIRPTAISDEYMLGTFLRALEQDEDFAPLRGMPGWEALLARLRPSGKE